MTRKKKIDPGSGRVGSGNGPSTDTVSSATTPAASPSMSGSQSSVKPKTPDPSTSALIICRNKHWRCKYVEAILEAELIT